MMYRNVCHMAEIIDSEIEISPVLTDTIISVSAEMITEVRTWSDDVDYYEGPYEFAPDQTEQTINIQDKMARRNIKINPIPSNYGLITWNGTTLTVS